MYKIGDSELVVITRSEANFDRACDEAYKYALQCFGIDQDGHSKLINGWERSQCCIEIKFREYLRMSNEHTYIFIATIKG